MPGSVYWDTQGRASDADLSEWGASGLVHFDKITPLLSM